MSKDQGQRWFDIVCAKTAMAPIRNKRKPNPKHNLQRTHVRIEPSAICSKRGFSNTRYKTYDNIGTVPWDRNTTTVNMIVAKANPNLGIKPTQENARKKTSRALTQGTSGTSCGKCMRTTVSQMKPCGSLHQIEIDNNGKRDCVSLWADPTTQIFVIAGSHKN